MIQGYIRPPGDTLAFVPTRNPRVLVTLSPEDYDRVRLSAESLGVSMASVVRDYVEWSRPIMDRIIEVHAVHQEVMGVRPVAYAEAVRRMGERMDGTHGAGARVQRGGAPAGDIPIRAQPSAHDGAVSAARGPAPVALSNTGVVLDDQVQPRSFEGPSSQVLEGPSGRVRKGRRKLRPDVRGGGPQ